MIRSSKLAITVLAAFLIALGLGYSAHQKSLSRACVKSGHTERFMEIHGAIYCETKSGSSYDRLEQIK